MPDSFESAEASLEESRKGAIEVAADPIASDGGTLSEKESRAWRVTRAVLRATLCYLGGLVGYGTVWAKSKGEIHLQQEKAKAEKTFQEALNIHARTERVRTETEILRDKHEADMLKERVETIRELDGLAPELKELLTQLAFFTENPDLITDDVLGALNRLVDMASKQNLLYGTRLVLLPEEETPGDDRSEQDEPDEDRPDEDEPSVDAD